MAILGSSIDPRLQLQDYSGFVNAAKMQAQGLAGIGQQISQAADQYKQYKQEQKEAEKRIKSAEVTGNAIAQLIPDLKGTIGTAIEKLRDQNIPLYERDAVAQSMNSILNLGVAEIRGRAEIGLKREQLGLEDKLAKQRQEEELKTVVRTVEIPAQDGSGTITIGLNKYGKPVPIGPAAQQTSQTGQVPIPIGDFDNPPGYGVPAFQETRSFPQLMYDIYDEETMNLINKASSENPNLSDQELMAKLDPTFKEIAIYSANAAKQAFDAEGKQAPSNYLDPNFIKSAIEMRGQMPPQGQSATVDANAAGIEAASRMGGIFTPKEPKRNIPLGYQWNSQLQTLEKIPGSVQPDLDKAQLKRANLDIQAQEQNLELNKIELDKKRAELASQQEAEKAKAEASTGRAENYLANLGDFKNQLELLPQGTGVFGAYMRAGSEKILGTAANKIQASRSTLDANAFVTAVARLREGSPTGSTGLGQFTEKEGQRMVDLAGSIDPVNIDTAKRNIDRLLFEIANQAYGIKEFRDKQLKDGQITKEQYDNIMNQRSIALRGEFGKVLDLRIQAEREAGATPRPTAFGGTSPDVQRIIDENQ